MHTVKGQGLDGRSASELTEHEAGADSSAVQDGFVADLSYFAAMDRINLAIQQASDLDTMMRDVLDTVLDVLSCDRASLLYPCDPDAPHWRVPMERTRPEHPGLFARGIDIPNSPEVRQLYRALLTTDEPLQMGTGSTDFPLDPAIEAEYGPMTALIVVIRPKLDQPWAFMVHDCSRIRSWQTRERQLVREISRRLADGLTTLLAYRELKASETRLRTLVQTIPDLVWVKDRDGRYVSCNRQFESFLGFSESELVGRTDDEFVDREQADSNRREDQRVLTTRETITRQRWIPFPGVSRNVLLEITKTPMRDSSGEVVGVLSIGRDVTERHQAEEQLRIAATAFETQEAIVVMDADRRILRVNRSFVAMTGYQPEEVIGRLPDFLRSGYHDDAFLAAIWEQAARDGVWRGEVWNRRKNGEIYPEWQCVTAVTNEAGTLTHFVNTANDISRRKAAENEIERLAQYDVLTHLPNRRLMMVRLLRALERSAEVRRHGALLFIDLDDFKMLNDTVGHEAGDQLLVETAHRLKECAREADTVARVGGDEFVMVLEDLGEDPCQAKERARKIAEEVMIALGVPYAIADRSHRGTSSIGLTLFLGDTQSAEELLKQADIALHQAKATGRNTVRFFEPGMLAVLSERAAMEHDLRIALDAGEFSLHFQPQVDGDGRILGAEVLLRWQHHARGWVQPSQFVPLAEETGLILPIGKWVLDTACATLAEWAAQPLTRDLQLAVNVSARQFRQPGFVEQVLTALQQSGAPASCLKIELTESLVLDDVDDTIVKMRALKRHGVGFSMDDFGTGYSSLAYLTRLPLDQLKIDKSFVQSLPGNANDAVIARTIITMARSLGLDVIAEGVETQAQREFLALHGCPTYQGFLFSKPVPLEEFMALLGGKVV